MKRIFSLSAFLLVFLVSSVSLAEDLTADEILKTVDKKLDISRTEVEFEMKVYRENTLRKTYRMSSKRKSKKAMLVETIFPPRNEGEMILAVGDNMNNIFSYLPNINKVVRISLRNFFSNSDFSNFDITANDFYDDYKPTLQGIEKIDGQDVYRLELMARNEDVEYAKIIYWIRKADLMPLKRDYYTFSGYLFKRLKMQIKSDIMGGMPDFYVMTSVLEKEKYTTIKFVKYKTNMDFPEEMYRSSSLLKR